MTRQFGAVGRYMKMKKIFPPQDFFHSGYALQIDPPCMVLNLKL